MSNHSRDRRPYLRPVTRVELPEGNVRIRWIAICVLLAVAVVAIGYGFYTTLQTEPGWQSVAPLTDAANCGDEFALVYEFGGGDTDPSAEFKKLELVYGELAAEAYRLFSPEAEGADNLYALNVHVNEPVAVAPALYRVLEQIVASGNRHVFLGPVRQMYDSVFLATTDAEAEPYDPMKDPELAAQAAELAAFCADPEMISLELPGDGLACLKVSQAYLSFAEEWEIGTFLDLGWMKNAFVADFLAGELENNGFVNGYLASYDGFTRNLDPRGTEYTVNIFHRVGSDVMMPANFSYHGPMSIVTLRDYPMTELDQWNYHAYQDGTVTGPYLDPATGLSAPVMDGVTAYSREMGCGEMALKLAPVYIGAQFDAYALESLAREGIESIRCFGSGIVCTEETAPILLVDTAYSLTVSNVQ